MLCCSWLRSITTTYVTIYQMIVRSNRRRILFSPWLWPPVTTVLIATTDLDLLKHYIVKFVVIIAIITTIVNIAIIAILIAEVDLDIVDITIISSSSAIIVLISVSDFPDPNHRCYPTPPSPPHYHHFYLWNV